MPCCKHHRWRQPQFKNKNVHFTPSVLPSPLSAPQTPPPRTAGPPAQVRARPLWLQKPGRSLHPCPGSASGSAEPHVLLRTPLPRAPPPPTSQPQGGAASSTQPPRRPRPPGRPGPSSPHLPGVCQPLDTPPRRPSLITGFLPPSSQPARVHSPLPCPHGPLPGDPPHPSDSAPKPQCPPALLALGPCQERHPAPSPTVSTTHSRFI